MWEPRRPRRLGRYTLHGEIASGGLGTVHLAMSSAPGGFRKIVAIKRLHSQFRSDRNFIALFLEEARLSARIAHANVVQTLDTIDADDEVLLVMEYVHGESLQRLFEASLRAGEPMPVAIAAAIVSGVLHGLEAAHDTRGDGGQSLGLVHRDVSPQNIIVGVDGVARLLDFGIARAAGQSHVTRERHVKGKIGYMAPEQLQGEAVTRRADLYACGVVLWELITGKRLFVGDTEAVAMARALDYTVPPPSELREDIHASLNRVVLRALARNASLRFESAAELAQALEDAIAPASAAVVGAWVRRLAGEALSLRAIERAACEQAASATGLARGRSVVWPLVLVIVALLSATAIVVRARHSTPLVRSDGEAARTSGPSRIVPRESSSAAVARPDDDLPPVGSSAVAPPTGASSAPGPRARPSRPPAGTSSPTHAGPLEPRSYR